MPGVAARGADAIDASGSQTLYQRNVIQNRDSGLSQEGLGRRVEEILVPCTKNISFANDCCLHDDGVVDVTNRRGQQGVRANDFSGLA